MTPRIASVEMVSTGKLLSSIRHHIPLVTPLLIAERSSRVHEERISPMPLLCESFSTLVFLWMIGGADTVIAHEVEFDGGFQAAIYTH